MSGQIFISYRRDDASHPAGRLYDHLTARFPKTRIFMDIDNLEPGEDFVEVIESAVASCDVLIAIIGKHWLTSSDEQGKRRLDNADDFVRLEISTALRRGIRVVPVLMDGALMPRSTQLPAELHPLARRQAIEVSHNRFRADSERLIEALNRIFEKAATTTPTPAPTPIPTSTSASTSKVSSDPAFYTERGWEFYQKKDYDKAISDYNAAIRLDPNYSWAYNRRGVAYYAQKDYDKAITDCSAAIRLDPNYAAAYYNRALSYYAQKDYDKAITDYNAAIRLDPNDVLAYYGRGLSYYDRKNYDKAISDYNVAIKLDPNDVLAYYGRRLSYYDQKDYDKAVSDYNAAIRLDPNYATAYYNRGLAYRQQGKNDKAQADFARAKQLGYSSQ
jgi:tetratricopeptide (TPR) repeat protein